MSISYDAYICKGCEAVIDDADLIDACQCLEGTQSTRVSSSVATRININTIVEDIIYLADNIVSVEESNKAWSSIQEPLSYLSAKDTMLKYKDRRNKED